MKQQIVNLTPVDITLQFDGGQITIPKSGFTVRLSVQSGNMTAVNTKYGDLPVEVRHEYGDAFVVRLGEDANPQSGVSWWRYRDGFPDNTLFITSLPVALKLLSRDVIAPATGPNDNVVRNEAGQIQYITKFIQIIP